VIVLAAAKLGGEIFERMGQPAVLGELVFGVLLGNLNLLGVNALEFLRTDPDMATFAQIGVLLLLFEVGLESNIHEMLALGGSSLLVAVLGVIVPSFLGWGVSAWMLPQEGFLVHLFLGATLCATSIGITARVLADLGKTSSPESKIILGAAVIDDILGLMILAAVSGAITAADTGDTFSLVRITLIVIKAAVFLGGAIAFGNWVARGMFYLATRLRVRGVLLAMALGFCFLLSYLADRIGLATTVGAFAAGLILDEVHYPELRNRFERDLKELVHPVADFLVPIFFVLMGIRVDLSSFGKVEVLGFALLLSLAAVTGKMSCAFGVLGRDLDRISVAVGMVPRGEVGLIFAGVGAALNLGGRPVISQPIFAAVIIMVIITALITPPALKASFARGETRRAIASPSRESS